jgi:hypothetical protein
MVIFGFKLIFSLKKLHENFIIDQHINAMCVIFGNDWGLGAHSFSFFVFTPLAMIVKRWSVIPYVSTT